MMALISMPPGPYLEYFVLIAIRDDMIRLSRGIKPLSNAATSAPIRSTAW